MCIRDRPAPVRDRQADVLPMPVGEESHGARTRNAVREMHAASHSLAEHELDAAVMWIVRRAREAVPDFLCLRAELGVIHLEPSGAATIAGGKPFEHRGPLLRRRGFYRTADTQLNSLQLRRARRSWSEFSCV